MVVFDGVTAALDAAVAMQQSLAARPVGVEPLAIRVGVSSGEAECEDDDYFGLPVVEAARLCARAAGGEILTTELVRMLARSRTTLELESVGALELKGLDEPVETYRVRWAPIAATLQRPPLPPRIAQEPGARPASGDICGARAADSRPSRSIVGEVGSARPVGVPAHTLLTVGRSGVVAMRLLRPRALLRVAISKAFGRRT